MVPFRCIPKYERLQEMAKRYPELDPAAVEACVVMLAVSNDVSEAIRTHLARHGLSEGRFLVLTLLLSREGQPLSHSELADLSGVTKGTITGLVDGLEQEGHVRRVVCDKDRRVTHIALTPQGQAYIEQVLPSHFTGLAALMGELSDTQRKTLVSLLTRVHAGIPALMRHSAGRDAGDSEAGPTTGDLENK